MDDDKPFTLFVVVPKPDEHGFIKPEENRYYEVTRTQLGRELGELPPGWDQFVKHDVAMAHDAGGGTSPGALFGTYLVNMAAFFNKKKKTDE